MSVRRDRYNGRSSVWDKAQVELLLQYQADPQVCDVSRENQTPWTICSINLSYRLDCLDFFRNHERTPFNTPLDRNRSNHTEIQAFLCSCTLVWIPTSISQ